MLQPRAHQSTDVRIFSCKVGEKTPGFGLKELSKDHLLSFNFGFIFSKAPAIQLLQELCGRHILRVSCVGHEGVQHRQFPHTTGQSL
ncbi:hypothetical protein INR49_018672 [Caranx melampygus]|nr:hypothetical protein INR49_018672 [Caranx melampygus]